MTFISTYGQALNQIDRVKSMQSQLADLQRQIASGKKAELFKGLGDDLLQSKRARADLSKIETYSANIDTADRRIKVMLNAIAEIKEQAGNIVNAIEIQTQEGEFEMESVGDLAGKVRDFMNDLINEKDGARFLFGGAAARDKPLNDTGTLDSYIKAQISDWVDGTNDTATFMESYQDRTQLNDTIIGYSAVLSSGEAKDVYIRVEENTEIDYTVLANDEGFRDILAATSVLENLTIELDEINLDPSDDSDTTVTAPGTTREEQNGNFYQVFNDLAATINRSIDRLQTIEFQLSQKQAQISQIQDQHDVEKNVLLDNVADAEDIDLNETAVKLNAMGLQLEASYRVTASISKLSLANYF